MNKYLTLITLSNILKSGRFFQILWPSHNILTLILQPMTTQLCRQKCITVLSLLERSYDRATMQGKETSCSRLLNKTGIIFCYQLYSVSTWNKIWVKWKTFQDFSTAKWSSQCCKIYNFKNSIRKNLITNGSGIKSFLVFQKKTTIISLMNKKVLNNKFLWLVHLICEWLNQPPRLSCVLKP